MVNKLALLTVLVKKLPKEGFLWSGFVSCLTLYVYHCCSDSRGLNIDVVVVVTVARHAHYKIQIDKELCGTRRVLLEI